MAEYAIGRRAPFVMVPRSLVEDPDIDPHTLAAYIALSYHADFGKESGAFCSDARAGQLVGMTGRTMRTKRKILRDKGWLEWISGQKHGATNKYLVHSDVGEPRKEIPRGAETVSVGGRNEVPPTKNHSTKNQLPADTLDRVWAHWEAKRADALDLGNRARPMARTKKRLTAINRIAKLGYEESDYIRAIDGCTSSEYHVTNGFLDIELICRDQEHFERFLIRTTRNGGPPKRSAVENRDLVSKLYG
jgi:hypothetical protein